MGEYSTHVDDRRSRRPSPPLHNEQDHTLRAGSLPTGAPQNLSHLNLLSEQGSKAGRSASTQGPRAWNSPLDREGIGNEDEGEEGDINRGNKEHGGKRKQLRGRRRKLRAIGVGQGRGLQGGSTRGGRGSMPDTEAMSQSQELASPLPWKLASHPEADEQGQDEVVVDRVLQQLALSPRTRLPSLPAAQKPFKILKVGVQYRFKGNASRGASEQQQILLAPVYIRIMGSNPISYDTISFVAKDFCVLLQMSKGAVRRTVGEYGPTEKKILPVICSHQDGTASIHMLICLTPRGIRRLLSESSFHLAPQVLKWAFDHIDHLCGFGALPGGMSGAD